jgi:hypothetical protein
MLPHEMVVALVVDAVIAASLVGLVARGRARQCWSFVAYLCAILTCDMLVTLWPARYYTREFWAAKLALYAILRMAVALEMTWRVVRAFPGAMRTARASALLVLVAGIVMLTGVHRRSSEMDLVAWQPGLVAFTSMLFTLTALLVAWYHLPVRRLHRSILGGFAVYSVFATTVLSLLSHAVDFRVYLNLVDVGAYLGVCGWWARACWAREEEVMPQVGEIREILAPAVARNVETAA